jgi:uncharacterized membrane protein HdeD (DUF308 family)
MAGSLGRGFRTEATLRVIGTVLSILGCLILTVQAFTEEKYPNMRWTKIGKLVIFFGFILYNFPGNY